MADTIEQEPQEGAETARTDSESVVSARDRFQRLTSDVQNRYERVSEDVRRGAERASQEIRRGTEKARERYGEVAESARERYTQAREKSGELTRDLAYYVRDNPGRSVAIAAGVGFLVGLLVRRGRSEDEI
ncbi:MAG TPA: hypothetical protein VKM72_26455 [Thermoanaerobaculia bacterium]|nr:hypothetical protein [Thermoanaerobaculia bacterium]